PRVIEVLLKLKYVEELSSNNKVVLADIHGLIVNENEKVFAIRDLNHMFKTLSIQVNDNKQSIAKNNDYFHSLYSNIISVLLVLLTSAIAIKVVIFKSKSQGKK
ncbi:hypothetical protein CJF42_26010, partial [Pseudoalteromonas sp. NBT06-2]|uniref:hypothetical protein n=1 Tax=Pseudoalteromonas sp. NBT06-2 TaxID=2025950 RepID=UPI000BCEAC22